MSIGTNIGVPIFVVNRHSDKDIGKNDGMSIGERVRKARQEKRMTQTELASRTGIRQATLSELENGDSKSTSYIASIAAALDVSALWLETGRGPQQRSADDAESDIDQVIQLMQLFRDSTAAGRSFILSSANAAEKKALSRGSDAAENQT